MFRFNFRWFNTVSNTMLCRDYGRKVITYFRNVTLSYLSVDTFLTDINFDVIQPYRSVQAKRAPNQNEAIASARTFRHSGQRRPPQPCRPSSTITGHENNEINRARMNDMKIIRMTTTLPFFLVRRVSFGRSLSLRYAK